jgi:hypothetical protein
MNEDDVIEVFAMKKPVWSFKFGPLLKYFVRLPFQFVVKNNNENLKITVLFKRIYGTMQ